MAELHPKYIELSKKYEDLITRKNEVDETFYNGIYDRYKYPVLTRDHIPLTWKYDVNHIGYKYNGNAIMAAIGLTQLKYLDEENA